VLYGAGATLLLPVSGYEAAVYELYPLDSARRPLLSDVTFERSGGSATGEQLRILSAGRHVHLLNPGTVASVTVDGKQADPVSLGISASDADRVLTNGGVHTAGARLDGEVTLQKGDVQSRFVVMLHPDTAFHGAAFPGLQLQVDGKTVKGTLQQQKGVWAVYSVLLADDAAAGKHRFSLELEKTAKVNGWSGHAEAWISTQYHPAARTVSITTRAPVTEPATLPGGYEQGALKKDVTLGGGDLRL